MWKIFHLEKLFFSPTFYEDLRKAVELQEKHDKLPHWCVKMTPAMARRRVRRDKTNNRKKKPTETKQQKERFRLLQVPLFIRELSVNEPRST